MNIDERLANMARNLDALIKIRQDDDREYRETFRQIAESQREYQREYEKHFRENQERFARTEELFRQIAESQRENDKRFSLVTRNFEVVLDSIKRLENVATAHEQRLDDLEGE